MPRTDCLSEAELNALHLGELPEASLNEAVEHLETCPRCEAAIQAMEGVLDPTLMSFRASARAAGASLGKPAVQLGGYEILGELGRGGMGVVYKARHRTLKRTVALKVLLKGQFTEPVVRQRFRAEAEAVARLQHPNIVQIHEVGERDDGSGSLQPYFTLEFVEGGNLADRLRGTPQPPAQAAAWTEALARAVHYAHEQGIVHRDLKPANILLTADGTPKITDFGIAKQLRDSANGVSGSPLLHATSTGIALGTPSYMAPEQAAGWSKHVGPAADVYALGVILYEVLTGRPPFLAASVIETLFQLVHHEPAAPRSLNRAVPRDLETVCLKCLEKEPDRRYASARALADDLQRFLAGRPVQARPVGPAGRAWKWVRRNPVVAALLAAVFVSLASGAGAFYWKYREAEAAAVAEANEKRAAEQARADAVAERDRAEVAQVTGLLRPFQAGGGPLSIEEVEALRDLRALPTDRLRVLFLERALASPLAAAKLHRRGAAVAHALAGLDRARAARLVEAVTVQLRGTAEPNVVDGCADVLAALLPPGRSQAAALLADALARRLTTEKHEAVLRDLAGRLAALAPHLGGDEAAAAAGALARRLSADSSARPSLSAALVALAGRLGPAAAAAAARPLARQIAEASDPHAFDQLAPPLTALAARMPENQAAALAGPALRNMIAMLSSSVHFPKFALEPHIAALAARLGDKEAEAAARLMRARLLFREGTPRMHARAEALLQLAGHLGGEKGAAVIRPAMPLLAMHIEQDREVATALAPVFTSLAQCLPQQDAVPLLSRAARALAGPLKSGPDHRGASALAKLTACLPKEEAAALVGPAALALVEGLDREKTHAQYVSRCATLKIVWEYVGEKDASAAARAVAGSFAREKEHLMRIELGSLLASMAGPQEEAGTVAARCLAEAVARERDWILYGSFATNFQAAARRLPATEAVEWAGVMAAKLGDPQTLGPPRIYARALTGLASRLGPKEAAGLARVLAERMTRRVEIPTELCDLAVALAALAERLPDKEGAAAVAPSAQLLTRRMTAEIQWGCEVLSEALVALAPRLAKPEASAALQAASRRVAVAKSSGELAALGEALAVLADRLDRKETAAALSTAAESLIERLALEKASPARDKMSAALAALGRRLDDGELVALLRGALCSGRAQSLVLDEFGCRGERAFPRLWDFVEWSGATRASGTDWGE